MRYKGLVYIIILSLFVTYLLFADYFFTSVLQVDNECARVLLDLPDKTGDIKMHFSRLDEWKIKWKDMIYLEGWAFLVSQKMEKNRYIVLYSQDTYYVFGVKDLMIRRDVADYFNIDNIYTGFTALIAKDAIKEGVYYLGMIIEDETGKYIAFTNNILTKKNNKVSLGYNSQENIIHPNVDKLEK